MRQAVVLLALAAGCTTRSAHPTLLTVAPNAASPGAAVVLTGEQLCGPPGSSCANVPGKVLFGSALPQIDAEVASYSDTEAQIVVPPVAAGATSIVLQVGDHASNALSFTVLP